MNPIFPSGWFPGVLCAFFALGNLFSQAPPSAGGGGGAPAGPVQPAPARTSSDSDAGSPAERRPGQGNSSFLGGDLPFLDPASETVTWDGRIWNINNNRIFQARFERYLNEPEETAEVDQEYNKILREILDLLQPGRATPQNLDEAFNLLLVASEFERDAMICDSIANQVHSAWQAQKNRDRLATANKNLEEERRILEWNSRVEAQPKSLGSAPREQNAAREWRRDRQLERDIRMQPYITRLAEVNASMKANEAKKELTELQAKVEFQALLLHLFMQRRLQHVLIGTRFYRAVFGDGQGQLRLGDDAKDLFSKTSGLPPNVSTLDALSSEMIRDVKKGVESFRFLLEKDELESASKRLSETFVIGEYLPEIRTLPREDKRRVLDFVRKANQLTSAIEVRDYGLAEKLIAELGTTAKDFDPSKPLALIQGVKAVSAMHLAKAKTAAVSGDQATFEAELRQAAELWPGNPALSEIAKTIFEQGDVQQKAILDFDQLYSQKNYRQIYEDRLRFIAATSIYPDRTQALQEVLEQMAAVEAAIMRAQEIDRRGDAFGAWESVERVYEEFPDDTKLNMVRADLTTKAADFVRSLRTAEDLEERGQLGSSLAWYLKAQQTYPPSDFAREGVDRIVPRIFPEAEM